MREHSLHRSEMQPRLTLNLTDALPLAKHAVADLFPFLHISKHPSVASRGLNGPMPTKLRGYLMDASLLNRRLYIRYGVIIITTKQVLCTGFALKNAAAGYPLTAPLVMPWINCF